MTDEDNPKLEKAMRGLAKEEIFVPPAADERVSEMTRGHFGKADVDLLAPRRTIKRQRRRPTVWQQWLPLAAGITIAALILYFSIPTEAKKADLNRDGAVDVIDALLMAEEIRAGRGRDINRDRLVDARDAAAIATQAVRLEGGGS
jgi:hypothetical protein